MKTPDAARIRELEEEVSAYVAALDSLETILFGDCFRRSRDELEARATDLVEKEKNLDATLRFMP